MFEKRLLDRRVATHESLLGIPFGRMIEAKDGKDHEVVAFVSQRSRSEEIHLPVDDDGTDQKEDGDPELEDDEPRAHLPTFQVCP